MKRLHHIFRTVFILTGLITAQDFQGTKIYINPGHGGNNPANDRYIAQTGFWESESNLTKGLYLRDLLEAHNAVVFMSRTLNREEDDLPLSEIDYDANANNVDYFHSIHSNAFNATVNYPLLLFHGYDNNPTFPASKVMGGIMWRQMDRLDNQWTDWLYSWENNRGDYDFYGNTSGLGVLRYLAMPGTLSEGTFHDYIPNSYRLMNMDYRRHESIVILRSFIEYYGLDPLPDGVIAGIVRDQNNTVTYSYNYNSGLPNDQKRTVNNARVTLLPDNRVYVGDFHYNGFYMFENVAPGDYEVVMEGGSYKADTVSVTAVANRTAFANGFLVIDNSKAPEIYGHAPSDGDTGVATHTDIELRFSQKMNKTSTESAISILPPANGAFQWKDNDQTLTFSLSDSLARNKEYLVEIGTGAQNTSGVTMADPFQFSFTTRAYHVPPEILAVYPADQTDSVFIYRDIVVTFDTPMRFAETEAAFSMDPQTEGTFGWDDSGMIMTFHPQNGLERKTVYTVTLGQEARNYLGVGMTEPYSFTFNTRQRNELELLESFPAMNAVEISPNLQFYLVFSGIINSNTVIGNFDIKDIEGNTVAYRGLDFFSLDKKGVIVLEPRITLKKNHEYVLRFYPGLKDVDGLAILDTIAIPFKTEQEPYASGTVVDNFEVNFGWLDPDTDQMTTGTDPEATRFALSAFKKISGSYSGLLDYTFTADSGGVCRLRNEEKIQITSGTESEFGLWIFGDYSRNLLEFWFDHQGASDVIVTVDTIAWAGWKMVTIPVSAIGATGDIYFQSIVIRQTETGYASGALYLDDVQYDILYTDIPADHDPGKRPLVFELQQNYPNPFNPVTTIVYSLGQTEARGNAALRIDLSIYNILGQKVQTLVSEEQTPGIYKYEWNASAFSSGIYFYRLQATPLKGSAVEFIQTRKLVLMK